MQLIATVNNINSVFSILEETFKDWVHEGRQASNKSKERAPSVYREGGSCWRICYIDADGERHYERFYWTPTHDSTGHRQTHDLLLEQAKALSKARAAWNCLDCSSLPRLGVL